MKWDLPKGDPPSYLDVANEVTADAPKMPRDSFVVTSMDLCLVLGCNPRQAAGVVGNAINESSWGQAYRANNLFGWKITKEYAEAYRKAHDGKGPAWWRAPGNKAEGATLTDLRGGDGPWCWYRAFSSLQESYGEWIEHFVPRLTGPFPYAAYKRCGQLFWLGGEWFHTLCAAGYKGSLTRLHPEAAMAEHKQLANAAITRWAQSRLGCKPDGIWGTESKATCVAFQSVHGLPSFGALDDATLAALARAPRILTPP